MEINSLTAKICEFLDTKLAEDITVLDVGGLTIVADRFVIATARNSNHVKTLAEGLEEKLSEEGIEPLRTEGIREGRWAVLDYGAIICHIFNDETRMMYCLEKLWGKDDNVYRYSKSEK